MAESDLIKVEEDWIPEVINATASDHQPAVICRLEHGATAWRRCENVMSASIALWLVRDAIRHHSPNLPKSYRVEPANGEEKAHTNHAPMSAEVKARIAAARESKRILKETFKIDDASGELHRGDTPGADENKEIPMSSLAKSISEGVSKIRKTKKRAKKAISKPKAAKANAKKNAVTEPKVKPTNGQPKATEQKAASKPAKPSRHQWYVAPQGEKQPTGGPFPNWHEAFQSVGHMGKNASSLGAGCYRIDVGGKKFIIAHSVESARKVGLELPTS